MPKKIFELAKDLDMGAIDLVESLKKKGYPVRNHMTSLSDDDVTAILGDIEKEKVAAAEAVKTTKKKTKKKTAKKKVAAKKKTAKKVVTVDGAKKKKKVAAKSASSDSDDSKKKTTIRKKAVIRRKSGSKGTTSEESPEVLETSSSLAEAVDNVTSSGTTAKQEEDSNGLRVVSRPEVVAEVEAIEKPPENATLEEKAHYKEKVHKFTPVFIPEKKDEPEKTDGTSTGSNQTATAGGTDSDKNSANKRLGGLASMMSGKKSVINKAQALNQSRADSEMKSYGSVSGIGRPIYTTVKRKRIYSGPSNQTEITDVKDSKRVVKLHNGATVLELAKKLSIKLKDFVDQCLEINLLVKGDDFIGLNLASEISAMFNYRVENVAFDEDAVIGKSEITDEVKSNLPTRNPIIAIMGHVDHGKTTLLDYIREAKVADAEAGGITQHIGAYTVKTKQGKELTFLDTPGHAAFGAMRQRGANITDIVVLVVAADDGVMPQTKESVKYIQNSGNPMIVAINKMDKDDANPDRIKNELTEFHITPEEWGGDTQMVPISALKGDGVDDLLEAIALQAEMLDLRADDKGKGEGVVIESKVEVGRGPIATVLIESGKLKKGDSIVVGETFGRARSLTDDLGREIKFAGPSTPVQILGLDNAPSPGDTLNIVKNEREAKKIVQNRQDERRKLESSTVVKQVSLEDFFAKDADENQESKQLNLVIRTDVQGSFEAIKNALLPLSNTEVEVRVIGGGVGPISDSDINLADSSGGFVFGFNMRPVTSARKLSEVKGVEVRTYSIIYELLNDVTLALEGMLDPEFTETYIGRAEVKETFSVPKIGVIAGSEVIDGAIRAGCNIRLLRQEKIMFDGKMSSLKRFKDDAKEVKVGLECGVGLENYNDIKIGDLFEVYVLTEKKRTLEDVAKAEKIAEEAAAVRAEELAAELAAEAAAEEAASSETTV